MTELRSRALRLLAQREHTRAELTRKLAVHGTREDIEAVINDLQARQLQSDARFAQSWLHSQSARFGATRLRQTLRQKGVADDVIDSEIADAELPDELSRARAVWARKFSAVATDTREWARQARFLQGRGFSSDVIRRLLKDCRDMTDMSAVANETADA